MNGPLKMYRTKPIVIQDLPVQIPKCMYSLKNIHTRDTQGMVDQFSDHVSTSNENSTIFEQVKQFLKLNQEMPGMNELVMKQEKILRQLNDLKTQMEAIKVDLKLNEVSKSKSSTTCTNVRPGKVIGNLPDMVVINASPVNPPHSLAIIQRHLSDIIDLRFTSHLHSSVSSLSESTKILEQTLLNYKGKTGIPKLNIRLIWKDVGTNMEFLVSRLPIIGEVNLLRYLSKIIQSSLSYSSDSDSVIIDSILDTCYQILNSKNKRNKAKYIVKLNKSRGNGEWLGGRKQFSIADVAAYSTLKQVASASDINVSMTKWYNKCETVM